MLLLQAIFLISLLLLSLPVLVFTVQIIAALPAYRRQAAPAIDRPSIAVLVPAHNEAACIAASLHSIMAQLLDGDRLLVVADNCSDDTAAVACAAGAEVLERSDCMRRGKGYALDFGVRHLEASPPQVVIIIDADCLLHPGALDRLARTCRHRHCPVQALYLMHSRVDASPLTRVAEFAWTVKNWLRPLGWSRLGMPCQLMGSGMAFPWQLIQGAPLASAHIVEDLKLGLDFAAAGQAPVFCPEAQVSSDFPESPAGGRSQRMRWEHGHLSVIFKEGPRLLLRSLLTRDHRLLSLGVDMCIPPLSLLVLLMMSACFFGLAMWRFTGMALPWGFAFLAPLVLVAALLAAWLKAGRSMLPPSRLADVPLYILLKIPLYVKFLFRRQVAWISSSRDKP